jgi:hypothetical protein
MKKILLLLAFCCNSAFAADAEREFRVSQIIVNDEKSAMEIIRKLKSGADFAQLAREKSIDIQSADAGGDIGWFSLKDVDESTGEMLRKMKNGEFSREPVKTGSYWTMYKVKRIRNDGETFEQIRDPDELPGALRQAEANRKAIQTLRTNAALPPFASMPPVTSVTVSAPAGATDYNSAYQTSSGCVFFYEKTATMAATHADWKGPACKGKPLSGKGTLRITVLRDTDGSKKLVQHEMRGTFINGLLSGPGEKANYVYAMDKTPIHDTYLFFGYFENGFLSGQGRRIWIGASTDRPSAVQLTGSFVEGVPSGVLRQVRSQPYEGATGDVISLAFGKKGTPYVEQAQVQRRRAAEGSIYFDDEEWTMYVETWDYRAPVAAVFVRAPDYKKFPNEKDYLLVHCADWRFETAAWECKDGTVRQRPVNTGVFLQAEKAAFSLAMQSGAKGLRVASNPPVYLIDSEFDKDRTVRCNSDWSECSGQAQFHMVGPYTWRGETKYRNGEIKPVGSGALLAYNGEDFMNSRMEVVAECRRLSSPTECESGTYKFSNGGSFEGPFRLKNVTYGPRSDSRIAGYEKQGDIELELYGWGRTTFSNGKWADVRRKNNEIVEVGDCNDPGSDESVTCTLRGQTVMFNYPRRASSREERSPARQPERSWAPERAPERFVPTPVPQRQPYILPGMR